MRPAIRDKFFEHNGDWKGWVVKYIALPLIALGLLTGCASSRQVAPLTAVTRAHIVGTAARVDTTITLTIKGADTTKTVSIKSYVENAASVDKAHKDRESDNRTKIEVANANRKIAEMEALLIMMMNGGMGMNNVAFDSRGRRVDTGSGMTGRNVISCTGRGCQ